MYPKSRKRKHRERLARPANNIDDRTESPHPDPALFIQAHEADLVRGPQAALAAQSLEVEYYEEGGRRHVRAGSGLIKWTAVGGGDSASDAFEEDRLILGHSQLVDKERKKVDDEGLWVDRYDARLLLDALPSMCLSTAAVQPSSPGGWSDLPSDAEDTFFFSPAELEDYHREKRRRLIDQGREERLRALRADNEQSDAEDEEWGGSDEEPDETQKELMRRTASHILTSPNPAQLEMRILANHGVDRRFAFLRGRWDRAWKIVKSRVRIELEQERERAMEKEKEEAQSKAVLVGLAGYGDSDDESAADEGVKQDKLPEEDVVYVEHSQFRHPKAEDNEEVQKARRARAREWAEKRRKIQSAEDDITGT